MFKQWKILPQIFFSQQNLTKNSPHAKYILQKQMRIEEVNYMNMIDWCLMPTLAVFQLYRIIVTKNMNMRKSYMLHSSNNIVTSMFSYRNICNLSKSWTRQVCLGLTILTKNNKEYTSQQWDS